MRKLSKEEFRAMYEEDLRRKKREYLRNDADMHLLDNNLRVKKAMSHYDNRRVNCGRC